MHFLARYYRSTRVIVADGSDEEFKNHNRRNIEALKQDRMRSILERLTPDQLSRIHGAIGDLRTAVIDEIGADHLHTHQRST